MTATVHADPNPSSGAAEDRTTNQPAAPADNGRTRAPVAAAPATAAPASEPVITRPAATPVADTAGGVPVPVAGGLLAVALLVGVLAGWLIRAARRDSSAGPTAPGPADVRAVPAPDGGDVAAERARSDRLAGALIDLGDRVTNPGLVDRVRAAVESAGWTVVDPRGQRFDPDRHRAVDHEATAQDELDRVVAATERLGYVDPDGTLRRFPEVVVYRFTGPPVPGASR
jgi:hypothetical protein